MAHQPLDYLQTILEIAELSSKSRWALNYYLAKNRDAYTALLLNDLSPLKAELRFSTFERRFLKVTTSMKLSLLLGSVLGALIFAWMLFVALSFPVRAMLTQSQSVEVLALFVITPISIQVVFTFWLGRVGNKLQKRLVDAAIRFAAVPGAISVEVRARALKRVAHFEVVGKQDHFKAIFIVIGAFLLMWLFEAKPSRPIHARQPATASPAYSTDP